MRPCFRRSSGGRSGDVNVSFLGFARLYPSPSSSVVKAGSWIARQDRRSSVATWVCRQGETGRIEACCQSIRRTTFRRSGNDDIAWVEVGMVDAEMSEGWVAWDK